jgi:replicative DNA helicase
MNLALHPNHPDAQVEHLPANIDAEQALLGALLYDNAAYERIGDHLRPTHFYDPFHQRLFAAIETDLRKGQLAEPILISERFHADEGFEQLGGVRYLADLVDRAPPAANAAQYARAVYDLAIRRDLIRLSGEIALRARAGGDDELDGRAQVEAAEADLFRMVQTEGAGQGFQTFEHYLTGAVQMAAEAYSRDGGLSGLSTGLLDLDQKLGGLHASDLIIIAARPSMGKAQPLDAGVLLADGRFMAMGSLRMGDQLASVDGEPSTVTGVHPQGEKEIFRVTLSDGRSAEACADHLWRVCYRGWPEPRILKTSEIADMLERSRYRDRLWIDSHSGDFGDRAGLRLDPYVLGALIGDGKLSDRTPVITSIDPEVITEMNRRLAPDMEAGRAWNDITFRVRTIGGGNRVGVQGMVPNRVTAALEAMGLHGCRSEDKFIPPEYLSACRAARLALLRGLLDTDGWVETFGAVRFCTTSPRLARDVVDLVRSLGGRAGVGKRAPFYRKDGECREGLPAFTLNIQGLAGDDLFMIRRKAIRVAPPKRVKRLTIAAVTYGRKAQAQCITVSHPSRLYITDDYVVTHNSALACNIAFDVAKHYVWEPQPDGSRKTVRGGVVAFFSLEMGGEQLAMRLLAEVSGVSSDRLRKGDINPQEFGRIRDAATEIQNAPLHIDATGGLALSKLCTRARRLKRTVGLDLVVVDYLQLIDSGIGGRDNRVQQVSLITSTLKALAKELAIPVIALAQLSRNVESRDDKKPQLSDLRESGSIEQDADVVMFIYREAYYLSRTEPREGTDEHLKWREEMDQVSGLADIIIGKQRHGPIGNIKVSYNEDLTKFGNLVRDAGRYEAHRQRLDFDQPRYAPGVED